jgi:cell division protein ZapA (FtsZ GTPase activity inhibitor)
MDPFSLATGVVGLVGVALTLVTGALGLIDKTVAAHVEAADELKKLQGDLEDLQARMFNNHTTLKVLASNTKDRAFNKLLRKYPWFTRICGHC